METTVHICSGAAPFAVRGAGAGEATDDELARASRAGSSAATEALIARYRARVYVFALSLLQHPEDAEDAVQETFVRVVRSLPSYEPRGQFRSWLFTIAANVCRQSRRRAAERATLPVEAVPQRLAEQPAPGGPAARLDLRMAVWEAIARLPAVYRGVVVLFYLEELSVREAASVLGRSPAAVKVQLWRARSFLARELADWLD